MPSSEPTGSPPDEAGDVRTAHLRVPRTARYCTLGAADADRWWVVLHGYAQLASEFIRPFRTVAGDTRDGADRFVIAPEGLSRFYRDDMGAHREVGASWMTREDRAAEIDDYVGYLDALVSHLRNESGTAAEAPSEAGLSGAALTVLGFSQGAATASRWAALGDAPVDRLVLWAGDLAHDVDLDEHGEQLRAMNLTVVAGTDDPYIPDGRRTALRERLEGHGIDASFLSFDGGHRLHRETLRRLASGEATPPSGSTPPSG